MLSIRPTKLREEQPARFCHRRDLCSYNCYPYSCMIFCQGSVAESAFSLLAGEGTLHSIPEVGEIGWAADSQTGTGHGALLEEDGSRVSRTEEARGELRLRVFTIMWSDGLASCF